ncbi:MAG: protein kinase, partial [Phycisphaerales bacterium]|nr:protein kinase [Phycisphaerales bacterium]
MTDRWNELERLFHDALDQPDEARADFVRDACAGDEDLERDVWRLLDAHRTGPDLEPAGSGLLEPGTVIGRFRIERHLASGGMGVVYEARQDNPSRQVALKVLRADFSHREALRRFEEESRLLGRLQHPGIAQIHEAGHATIEGRRVAYIAMELIRDARSITDHVESRGLDTRQRLALFARVCDAVRHGHACAV